jgi:hypothetical protein
MIQVQLGSEGYWPAFVCDSCGHMVQTLGNVLWAVDPTTGSPTEGPFLTHNHCHDLFVAQWPDRTWQWTDLSTFMTRLIVDGGLVG